MVLWIPKYEGDYKMEDYKGWDLSHLTGTPTGKSKKLFQSSIDKRIHDEFKIICVYMGKPQKEVIEICMSEK